MSFTVKYGRTSSANYQSMTAGIEITIDDGRATYPEVRELAKWLVWDVACLKKWTDADVERFGPIYQRVFGEPVEAALADASVAVSTAIKDR
jgi:hypothetical protein